MTLMTLASCDMSPSFPISPVPLSLHRPTAFSASMPLDLGKGVGEELGQAPMLL